ncbi:MAG: 23S rRNA (adenine(2503)-C(2))-methyltransferase RlmN [Syntrophales bacterium LBB04]|nr:23S rRNA (adenine(2503)-C(2))-methyltransferase RlmN [Syntrophales bacterium LBB04]
MEKLNLKNLSLGEIESLILGLGKEKYRAKQIMKGMYQQGATSFDEMTTLARDFRASIGDLARIGQPEIVKVRASQDGTKKILFKLEDDLLVESVLIPGKNHWTACLSTQVGCRMGCRFCFTGRQGLKRNLLPSEITGQLTVLTFNTQVGPEIKSIVLMGMGEPLDNYENTLKAIRLITSDPGPGFSNRKLTLSTCGVAPMIAQLGKDVSINLAVSLNGADNKTRSALMPINNKYPLEMLLDACRNYPMPGRRMLSFEYILIAGLNDSTSAAEKLVRLLRGIHCKLNLIAFNEYPESEYRSPKRDAIQAFQQILLRHHYTAILRKSMGSDILAACGQLSGQMNDESAGGT